MVKLNLPQHVLALIAKLSGEPREIAQARKDEPAIAADDATPESAASDFETEVKATSEDRTRARRASRVLNRPGPTNWHNIADRQWLANQRSLGTADPPRDPGAIRDLAERLKGGATSGFPPLTLASSLRMRTIRQGLRAPHKTPDHRKPSLCTRRRSGSFVRGSKSVEARCGSRPHLQIPQPPIPFPDHHLGDSGFPSPRMRGAWRAGRRG